MIEPKIGWGRAGCLDKYGRFDNQEMYRQIYFMQVKDKVKQKVIAYMYDIGITRVGQIKKQYAAKEDKS